MKLIVTLLKRGPLTAAEAKVLRYICEGFTRNEIAGFIYRSYATVSKHCEAIGKKLSAHSMAEIVIYAVALELVKITLEDAS